MPAFDWGIPVFPQYQTRFRTADFGWFAGGASTDGQHIPVPNTFFSEFDQLRQSLPIGPVGNEARKMFHEEIQHAVFDMATLWDRTFSGTTMIMHVEGTTVPNTPALIQYLRCATYLPPSFIADNPASHGPIARIVQTFLKCVGVPTVQKWHSNANARGWPLTQPGPGAHANTPSNTLIPQPAPGSTHYKFLGRPSGAIDELVPSTTAPSVVIILDDDDDFNDSTLDFMQLMERVGYAETEAQERLERIRQLEEQETILMSQVAALEDALTREREANTHLRASSRSHTPARSQPYVEPQTPPRRPPPYSGPSSNVSRLMSPLPPSLSRYRASPFHHAAHQTDLDTAITSYGLDDKGSAIKLVMRAFDAAKWYEELLRLEVPEDVASSLRNISAFDAPSATLLAHPSTCDAHFASPPIQQRVSSPSLSPLLLSAQHSAFDAPSATLLANPSAFNTHFASPPVQQHVSLSPHLVLVMPAVYSTIASASRSRIRVYEPALRKTAPRTPAELAEKKETRERRQAEINAAMEEWRDATNEKASELAARFDMKPRYFLDVFFQGGAHMINHQEKINAYNVFKSEKVAENRELGISKKVHEIHSDHIEEYNALTEAEKAALVERFSETRERNQHLRRDTPRANIQDVSNVVRNMKMLMSALATRVGIEGFFCIVHSNAEFHTAGKCHDRGFMAFDWQSTDTCHGVGQTLHKSLCSFVGVGSWSAFRGLRSAIIRRSLPPCNLEAF
ncbi:hypothetical protein B0H10DRAFT_1945854 [Mycena sp. CBHHK59/15]|nr:hypothetical protein B0H10DRAFT_1945854 [Mycena sp. CBHHK59/15]